MMRGISCLLGSDNELDNQQLLGYIMERYANMRGTYFAKDLKGNNGQATGQKLLMRLFMRRQWWNWMEIRSSTTTHQSAKLFGSRLQSACLNWQTNWMVVIMSKEKLLKSLIPTKHVVSCRVNANKRKFGIVERACLLIRLVKSCRRQFVAATPHHLMGIAKKPFHSISVHGLWANTLALITQ